jgi:DNA-binding Lrp family transcriptional regulator
MQSYTRLSEKERIFLASCLLDADGSDKELGEKSGLSQHATRNVRSSLLRRGLISPFYHIDLYALGFLNFTTFFNRGAESSAGQRRLEQSMMTLPRVLGFNRMGGGYRYMLWFWAKQVHEAEELFTTLRPTEAGAHFEKTVRLAFDWTVFTPRYLSDAPLRRAAIHMTSKTPLVSLDKTDDEILRALSTTPGASLPTIARTLSLPTSTLQYRIDKLKERRIIRGKLYRLATDKIGVQSYRVLIVDRGMSEAQKDLFRKEITQCPNVLAALSCTGNWDYELRFETENSRELDTFCQSLYDTFGGAIDSIKILQQFEILKRLGYPSR